VKILSQYNRSLEESEEEWALVEMLGMKFVIRLERGDKQPTEYGDVECFTLEEMKNYPKTLGILMNFLKETRYVGSFYSLRDRKMS
jgi:hypothetical protein